MATASYTIPQPPFFMQRAPGDGDPIVYSAEDFRRYTGATCPRTGVLGSSAYLVTQADNVAFKVRVNSGFANVGRIDQRGDYIVHLLEDQELDLAAAGFVTNPAATRTHKVFIAVYDALTAGAGYHAQVVVTEDLDGGGAPAPDGAVVWLPLALVSIAKNQPNIQNKNITNNAQHGGDRGDYVDLTLGWLGSGFESPSAGIIGQAKFRAVYCNGGIVRLGGAIQRTGGASFAAKTSYDIGNMHSNLRPKQTRFLTAVAGQSQPSSGASGTFTCRLQIATDGTMTIFNPSGQTPDWVGFDGVTYDLD